MTRTACTIALIVCVLSACGPKETAQVPSSTSAATTPTRELPQPDTSPEKLLAEPPSGWQLSFSTAGPGIRLAEYVPLITDQDTWIEKVTFESFSDPPLPDAIETLKSIAADQRQTCRRFFDYDTFSGVENDYPTSVRLFVCTENPVIGKGQLTLVKTIRGDSHFFVITRALRVPPMQAEGEPPMPTATMAEWSLYMRAITACNAADPRHPCPTPPAADAETAAKRDEAPPPSE